MDDNDFFVVSVVVCEGLKRVNVTTTANYISLRLYLSYHY